MAPAPPTLMLDRVGRSFDEGRIVGVADVSLSILPGELVAIHGPSGCGKSTLLNLMSGMDPPTEGTVAFEGHTSPSARAWTRLRASRIGLVFQDFNLLPTMTARENVELAMFGRLNSAPARRREAMARLAQVGVEAVADRRPPQLSGGERRRVAIARSLANDPVLLLADEPTSNLDSATGAAVLDLLLRLHDEGDLTLVVVSHDLPLIERCRRRIMLRDGRIAADEMARQAA